MNEDCRGINIQHASKAGITSLKRYCMKSDSRVAGPWADKEIYMGMDLWPEHKMPEWQQDLLLKIQPRPDDRKMIWIYDPIGNNGKTKFLKYLAYKKDAAVMAYGHSGDVLNLASKLSNKRVYAWNLTRAKPANLSELDLYSAMESIKDGLFINTKYETSMCLQNPSHIIVCANNLPKRQHISADRWDIYEIRNGRLEAALTPPEH
jgi:hypothetical protein